VKGKRGKDVGGQGQKKVVMKQKRWSTAEPVVDEPVADYPKDRRGLQAPCREDMMRRRKREGATWIVIAVLAAVWIMLTPSTGLTLLSFKSLGIDQKSMQVEDPSKLKEMGMKDVKKGDRITVTGTEDKRFSFFNSRTGEKLIYPEKAPEPKKRR
jgi:hypothetical protein